MWTPSPCKKQWKNGMDSKFRTADDIFRCKCCGDCCKGFGGTYVTPEDIDRISRFIRQDPASFVEDFCDMAGSRPVLTQGRDGRCIFFKADRQCTIHPVKPRMCRAWPFLPTLIRNPENWNAMATACPGMIPDIPSKDLARIVACEQEKLEKAGSQE